MEEKESFGGLEKNGKDEKVKMRKCESINTRGGKEHDGGEGNREGK